MRKIGILTTYFATNFGAMLQPYALKRTLEMMGYDVELIRYKQPKVYTVYEPLIWGKMTRRKCIPALGYLRVLPILLKKKRVFMRYMHRYLQPHKGFLKKIPTDKDFYIFGSDQIWNPVITGGFDDVYFGNFEVKEGAKKIAYAASAESIDYTEEQCDYLKKNLANFDSVGVRETKLAEDLKRVTNRQDILTVVDPTLLVNPQIYQEIEHRDPLPGKKYVLFYKIRNCMCFANRIYDYAQSKGWEMLIFSSWYEEAIIKFADSHECVTYIPTAGIEYFLGAIQNAEFIFTPSFHGCVFPILYHKPFYSLVLKDTWNTRAKDLLCSLKLQNRLLEYEGEIEDDAIDYSEVELLLDIRRKESMNYLINALK